MLGIVNTILDIFLIRALNYEETYKNIHKIKDALKQICK